MRGGSTSRPHPQITMSRFVEIAIAFFFISHIPITIFVDSQAGGAIDRAE